MSILSTNQKLIKVGQDYSAGSGISIDDHVISVTGEFGKTYSAGQNVDIYEQDEQLYISSKDWEQDIANASANAYNAATAQIPDPFDPSYLSAQIDNKLNESDFTAWQLGQYATDLQTIEGQISNKLDTSSFSDVSGSFLTAINIPESATWNEVSQAYEQASGTYLTSVSIPESATWQDVSETVQTNSAQWADGGTGDDEEVNEFVYNNSATINEVNTSYQTNSGTFLTAAPADMATTGDVAELAQTVSETYQVKGDYLVRSDSANFYPANNPSSFATEDWVTAQGYITGVDLSEYAKRDFVLSSIESATSGKLDVSSFASVSSDFLTTSFGISESGTWNDVSETVQTNSAQWSNSGSTPTYGYTNNGLISAIDASGLYATSALEATRATVVKNDGTLGYNLSSYLSNNSSYFYWMPAQSPWTTGDYANVIFSPLQYATGACLAMNNPATFKGFYKGNEWFIANTVSTVGQMLRGEVHRTRGVHISGATTAGYGFDLNISGVSGVNSTGSWQYGHAEDAALRAVSSCDMHESAFGYDASDNITGYNGSAFAAGDEFPASANEAITAYQTNSGTYLTAHQAISAEEWNDCYDNVNTNSGAWGGSALPISAGPGIKFSMVDNTLVASTSGYVWQSALLFHTDSPVTQTTYTLSDDCNNYDKLEVDFYDINGWRTQMDCSIPTNLAASGTRGGYFSVVPASTETGANVWFKAFNWTAANTTWSCYCSEIAAQGGSTTQTVNANQPDNPPKVINIIGWKRAGGN